MSNLVNETILAISAFCSLNMNSLAGYYQDNMDKKMECQKQVMACIDEKWKITDVRSTLPCFHLSGAQK